MRVFPILMIVAAVVLLAGVMFGWFPTSLR